MFRVHSQAGHFRLYEGGVAKLTSIAVLWSELDDWTVPHLIAPTELAGSILHSLPSAVFIASSDAKDVRADRTRNEYAPGFLIKTPTGQPLIAVKGLQREHGIAVIDIETGKASGIETDNLTFFTSWRIVTKVLDKYETVCSFPSCNENKNSVQAGQQPICEKDLTLGSV